MSQSAATNSNSFPSGRPVVFRNTTVLTIDPSLGMIENGDVLVTDNRVAEVGRQPVVSDSLVEIGASGDILLPSMVDTHRCYTRQTSLRRFGADWTLTNYFQFYYLIKNDQSPVMFPLLHPYKRKVFQAERRDVHTVMVDGMLSRLVD